jgi:hypothetical protein
MLIAYQIKEEVMGRTWEKLVIQSFGLKTWSEEKTWFIQA